VRRIRLPIHTAQLAVFGLVVVAVSGCSQTKSELELCQPLSVGNTWVYGYPSAPARPPDTFRVYGSYRWHDITIYRAATMKGDQPQWDSLRMYVTNGELRVAYSPPENDSNDYVVILKEPIEVGNAWLSGGGGSFSITSTAEHCVVTAGTFDKCVAVRDGDYTEYYAPGVGRLAVARDGVNAVELLSYTLK